MKQIHNLYEPRSLRRSRNSRQFRPHGNLGKTLLVQRMRKRLRDLLNPTRGSSGSKLGTTLVPTPTRRRIKKMLSKAWRSHASSRGKKG